MNIKYGLKPKVNGRKRIKNKKLKRINKAYELKIEKMNTLVGYQQR